MTCSPARIAQPAALLLVSALTLFPNMTLPRPHHGLTRTPTALAAPSGTLPLLPPHLTRAPPSRLRHRQQPGVTQQVRCQRPVKRVVRKHAADEAPRLRRH